MSAKKESRNAQRKRLYAQLADASSRNEATLDGPVVGRFVTLVDEDRFNDRKPHAVLVHDDDANPVGGVATKVPKREPSAQKRRRQLAAWARCWDAAQNTGAHSFTRPLDGGGVANLRNCRCCGCPKDVAFQAVAA